MSNPRYDDRKGQGWYMRDNRWFLTFGAIMKEFKISKESLRRLLRANKVETRTLINFNTYNLKAFTVYSLDGLKRLVQTEPVRPLINFSFYEKKAYELSKQIVERSEK